MIHRREISPGDPRGNDSVVMDDAFVASLADSTADLSAYLFSRQVSARLAEYPLTLHAAVLPALEAYAGAVGITAVTTSLPLSVHLHSLVRRDLWYPNETRAAPTAVGGAYGARFQQLPRAPGPIAFDFSAWLACVTLVNVTETTLDFNTDLASAQARRLKWRSDAGSSNGMAAGTLSAASPTSVTFDAELIRSFLFSTP